MMAKQILILFQAMMALVLLVEAVPEFKYVGQYNGKDYWASLPEYTEPSGKIYVKCQSKFGLQAFTCSVNNAGEWNYVRGRLSANFQCPGCTRNFWINGKYDRPHGAGENVVITVTGSTVGTKISPIANQYRYICEVPVVTTTTTTQAPHSTSQDLPPNPPPVQECENENDVIVLLDSSGSIGIDNYKIEKVFAYNLARVFANRDASRFGFTIFSDNANTLVPLDNIMTNDEIYAKIVNATYLDSTTNTHYALSSATTEFYMSNRQAAQKLVVITDGRSNYPSFTRGTATTAKNQGIVAYAVGIGSGVDPQELLDIAGGIQDHVFTAATFDDLTDLIDPVGDAVCN